MIDVIRMEILAGIRDDKMFCSLDEKLAAFSDWLLDTEFFVTDARLLNLC